MTLSEFQTQYLAEHPFMWLALAALLGIMIGVRIGRSLERARAARKSAMVEVPDDSEVLAADDEAVAGDVDGDHAAELSGYQIRDLVGITARQVKTLGANGIKSVDQLRDATKSKKDRESLADKLQLEDFVVNKWARMADFLSLEGMDPATAEFLVFAGINSTGDLASRNPESVAHKLQNLNEKESRIDAVPTRQQLEAWVSELNA